MDITRTSRSAIVVAPLVALMFGVVTSRARDQVGASNVGIGLAIIVAGAAIFSRRAGLVTAVVAAMSFNYFHAKPYHSLRIHEPGDVAIVALLAVLGLVISDITSWRRRHEIITSSRARATEAPSTIGAMLAGVHPVGEVWPAVIDAVLDQLSLAECGVVAEQPLNLSIISRSVGRGADGSDTFVLPAQGASIAIVDGPRTLGHLIVMPPSGSTSLTIERRVIIALADHVAISLTYGDRALDTSTPPVAP